MAGEGLDEAGGAAVDELRQGAGAGLDRPRGALGAAVEAVDLHEDRARLRGPAPAQHGRDGEVGAAGEGDHAAGVTAREYHARVGGERQPLSAGPAQRGDDGPLADPARGVDAGDPVRDITRR